jgi:hypothetical protein
MIKNTKLRSERVKRARKLIYTAERQASRDLGLAGLRLKPGSSQDTTKQLFMLLKPCWRFKTESKFKYLVKVQE